VTDAPERLLDIHNLQPLCKHCHDTVKPSFERQLKQGKITVDDLRMGSCHCNGVSLASTSNWT
jgi:hypothetical protein